MSIPTRAVDCSFDVLTQEEANCLRDQGWPVFVQCFWTGAEQPAPRVVNLRVADWTGLRIAGYISLTSTQSGAWHVDRGRSSIPDDLWDKLDFVAIDIELRGIHLAEILNAIDRVEELGKKAVLYTNYNSWINYVIPSNPDAVSLRGVPLWNAAWDMNPDFDFPSLRYGGWRDDQVFMEQWSGGSGVCGQFVYRNAIVNPRLIYSVEEEEEMTPQEMLTAILKLGVPIYGQAMPVSLSELLHHAYYGSPIEHKDLASNEVVWSVAVTGELTRRALNECKEVLGSHIKEHNQSGGPIDRYSGEHLERMSVLLDQLSEEAAAFAARFNQLDDGKEASSTEEESS